MLSRILNLTLIAIMICCVATVAYGQRMRSMLSRSYPDTELQRLLVAPSDFHPFPRWSERSAWDGLPAPLRQFLISRGEKYLNYQWPALPATLFLEFARTGNRENFQRQGFARRDALCHLVLAECAEGQRRFLDDIVNGIWAICEESYWGVPAHVGMQKQGVGLPDINEPTVDLFVSETGALLAWTSYLLGEELDRISPLINQRILTELDRRLLTPCWEREDFWWMGFIPFITINNWNPWVNSNWLAAILLTEKKPGRRIQAIEKIMRSLDAFIDSYPDDGGCDEGPNYWGRAAASLFDCLELLYLASNGRIQLYDRPLIREMARFIYRVHIGYDYYVNFADAAAIVYPEPDLVFRFGQRIGDELMQGFAGDLVSRRREPRALLSSSIGRQLPAIFNYEALMAAEAQPPLPRDVWLPGNQVMVARSQTGSSDGLFVAAMGGHNAESHNHNDVGNFIVYMNGVPMIIDVGVESYTRKTFSPQRYEIWTMQSAYHNLPTINGVMQKDGRQYAARDVQYSSNDSFAQLQLNIAGAYPPEAGINDWVRTIRLDRGQQVVVTDAFELSQPTDNVQFTLMTAAEPELVAPGQIQLRNTVAHGSAQLQIYFDPNKLKAELEIIRIEDDNLKRIWGQQIHRILLKSIVPFWRESLMLNIGQ